MKMSISNIAWNSCYDIEVYEFLKSAEFQGIEIAPTKVFGEKPYKRLEEAAKFQKNITEHYGLLVSSIQSIWYGRNEKIFASPEERDILLEYTKSAVRFASALNCHNLVFGCPKNRVIGNERQYDIALDFFYQLGEFAYEHNTVIAVEANPAIYNTNFINYTQEAVDFTKRVGSPGCKVNFDLGTLIQNGENLDVLCYSIDDINHVHISEPNLAIIKKRGLHKEMKAVLDQSSYDHFISIEMGEQKSLQDIFDTILYIREVFK